MAGPGTTAADGNAAGRCVRLCDPAGAGALPASTDETFAARKLAYSTRITDGTTTAGATNQPPLTATTAEGPGFWDPITAAQASLGGFCCAAPLRRRYWPECSQIWWPGDNCADCGYN